MLDVTVNADPVAVALGNDTFILHINKLVLEGRASRVDYKNFHTIISFPI